jgi:hypothetical protein
MPRCAVDLQFGLQTDVCFPGQCGRFFMPLNMSANDPEADVLLVKFEVALGGRPGSHDFDTVRRNKL